MLAGAEASYGSWEALLGTSGCSLVLGFLALSGESRELKGRVIWFRSYTGPRVRVGVEACEGILQERSGCAPASVDFQLRTFTISCPNP